MGFMPIMWVVWSSLVVITAGLYIYRSSLTRDEEDQIFLDDSFEHEKAAQAVIVSKVARVEPYLHVAQWLVLAMTAVVVIYYVWNILEQLNIVH
ncbi:MAG: hypothetical protein ACLGRW_04110 [Acidobacteriota bacterium]